MYRLTDKKRTLQFWAQIAQGINVRFLGAEHFAVSDLADLGGERGRAILRELHARDLVREPHARAYLQWLASRNFVPLPPGQPKDTGAARAPERRPLPPRRR
ncbi:MAG TPA: hypothetical protein VNI83_10590 [Vicinamibacterales bacterium]|nr:hypothetical protein [Vicinamibacterales bacterium]